MNSPRRFLLNSKILSIFAFTTLLIFAVTNHAVTQEQQKEVREEQETSEQRDQNKQNNQENQADQDDLEQVDQDQTTLNEARNIPENYNPFVQEGITYPNAPVMPWDQNPRLDLDRYLGFAPAPNYNRPYQTRPWGRQQFYGRQYNRNLYQQDQTLRGQPPIDRQGRFTGEPPLARQNQRRVDQYPYLDERQKADMLDEDIDEGRVDDRYAEYYDQSVRQDLPRGPRPAREGRLHPVTYDRLELGFRNMVQGNLAEAANIFNQALQRYPNSGLPKIGLALANGLDGDVNRSLATFQSVLNNNPRDLNRVMNKDLVAEAAVDLMERVETIENNEPRHFFLMSILNYIRGDLDRAEYWIGEAGLQDATFGPAGTLRNMIAKSRQVGSMVPRIEEPQGLMY